MSNTSNRQCPSCEQLIPSNIRTIKTKNGKEYHEACAKEIAEEYLEFTMNSKKIKFEEQTKIKNVRVPVEKKKEKEKEVETKLDDN